MKRILLLLIFSTGTFCVRPQDISYSRTVIDTLTSPLFKGRGYTGNGMEKAAVFLAAELRRSGLAPLAGESYFQKYNYPVNTFPGYMKVRLNGKKLVPGRDFLVSPDSKGSRIKARLIRKDTTHFYSKKDPLFVSVVPKLTWSVSSQVAEHTVIQLDESGLKSQPRRIRINIENRFINSFDALNVSAVVKGTKYPDSMVVFTAHYDHLGEMGAGHYFPGANDNASGTAMVLSLARYYSQHPQAYSMVFLFFSGEEAGLLGSRYFTDHPPIPLNKIRLLVNFDIVGTGDEGITIVNADGLPKDVAVLDSINQREKYLVRINKRKNAPNSDHYFFTKKGVPSVFIYTLGGIKAYHDIFDQASTLPLTAFGQLFQLMKDFNTTISN